MTVNKRFVQSGSGFLPYYKCGHPAAQTSNRYTSNQYDSIEQNKIWNIYG
jgi:hypothetical protein